MFGSRRTVGAASIPATAPSIAARPQPIASIHPTRTPTSRLASGLSAEARRARPTFVNWKNAHRSATSAITTANVPTSCCEIETPPTCHVSFGNGLGNALISADQIRLARPLKVRTRPIVMITIVRTDAFETGAITTR